MMFAAIALLALLALGKRAPTSTPSSTSSSTTRATETTATPEAALRHARRSVRSHPASSTSTSSSSSSVFNPAPSDSARAANELGSFLVANPSALRSSSLTVAALQARMGSLVADGLVGPATRARAKALGVVLP
jgi:hypothetical protein